MAYGVRRWQTAANGPQRDRDNKLMHMSGVYMSRHKPQGDMINAYYNGTPYEALGGEVIPDNGGQRTLIGVEEAKDIVYVAERPWAEAEDILKLALSAFATSAAATWVNLNVEPILSNP